MTERDDIERVLAEAMGRIAIEDRDRVLAGDYQADTYAEHAARYLAALEADDYTIVRKELVEAARAFVAAFEMERRWREDAEFPSDEYIALRAATETEP